MGKIYPYNGMNVGDAMQNEMLKLLPPDVRAGCLLSHSLITISFVPIIVITRLKLCDRGWIAVFGRI
jgi:hypothetical protein